jgi:hypothetical protein
MGVNFPLPGAIFSTLFFIILNNISPYEAVGNWYLVVARYLAALMLGFAIYSLLYKHLHHQFIRLKIKYRYRNHVIVFSMRTVNAGFFADLLANDDKVILVGDQAEDLYSEKVERDGVIVFREDDHGPRLFDPIQLAHASACVIAFEDDSRNIGLSLKLIKYLMGEGTQTYGARSYLYNHSEQPGSDRGLYRYQQCG